MVDSCRTCASCQAGDEQFCEHFPILTYNGEDKHLGGVTYGGYSESIVVDENFVLKVSENLNLATVAPLLCAGITTYSPLRHWKVSKGQKVGIVEERILALEFGRFLATAERSNRIAQAAVAEAMAPLVLW